MNSEAKTLRRIILRRKTFFNLMVFLVIFIGVFTSIYLSTSRSAVNSLTESALDRQLVLTQSGAATIESFLYLHGRSLVLLSNNQEITSQSPSKQELIDNFVDRRKHDGIVVDLGITDATGLITAYSGYTEKSWVTLDNVIDEIENTNFSDRDYFQWALTAPRNDFYVTRPTRSRVGASNEQMVIFISSPIHSNGNFDGLVVTPVILDSLVERYLTTYDPISEVYLFAEDGTILVVPTEIDYLVGENIFDTLSQISFVGMELAKSGLEQILANPETGKINTIIPSTRNKGQLKEHLITYTPIILEENGLKQRWTLVVVSPTTEVLGEVAPIYLHQLTLVIGIFFFLLLFSLTVMRVIHIKLED
jgi:hypothetical protein